MDIDNSMLQWSQTVYGVAHSLHLANSIKLGNLTTLIESLSAAERWNQSDLGFTSSLPTKDFRDGSINLDGKDHGEVFGILSENIVKILFVNLAVLADECLNQLITEAGATPPNYLTSKVEWVKSKIDAKYEWAANGMLELCALRNAVVHNGGKINKSVVDILQKAGVGDAKLGHEVSLSFSDLFRYRRALRTVIGELQKLKKNS
ncbi:hypothetical protein ABB25_06015 [Stenotrophomonas koreensis]|uniref:RiboL-PSP-HEPN domain-containing protein n=1 Tax=Stenotrophomonas koreensis TaxID=266128 RepID=A0A0R0BYY3_9GAMM|nr:hypothetical protein [Stenotrophomonas koreensis]KRG58711.1 hypothetical protein ABB25_06015 [Stenotrophomonas koreensis]